MIGHERFIALTRDLGRTSALRSPRQCTPVDEGAGLRPLDGERFI